MGQIFDAMRLAGFEVIFTFENVLILRCRQSGRVFRADFSTNKLIRMEITK